MTPLTIQGRAVRGDTTYLTIFTIYNSPSDYPGMYVVRAWDVKAGQPVPCVGRVCKTLEEARSALPKGLTNIGRHRSDDPAIEECWL